MAIVEMLQRLAVGQRPDNRSVGVGPAGLGGTDRCSQHLLEQYANACARYAGSLFAVCLGVEWNLCDGWVS